MADWISPLATICLSGGMVMLSLAVSRLSADICHMRATLRRTIREEIDEDHVFHSGEKGEAAERMRRLIALDRLNRHSPASERRAL